MPMLIMEDIASGHKNFFCCASWQDPRGGAEETHQGINLQSLPANQSQDSVLEQQVSFLVAIPLLGSESE